mmetsp:Transcript_21055/g.65449  ORF Transcript_21055/g.65449 Transcript_21055/m.65449 type:complete len:223 (-) Transcript_21055:92-760(-)
MVVPSAKRRHTWPTQELLPLTVTVVGAVNWTEAAHASAGAICVVGAQSPSTAMKRATMGAGVEVETWVVTLSVATPGGSTRRGSTVVVADCSPAKSWVTFTVAASTNGAVEAAASRTHKRNVVLAVPVVEGVRSANVHRVVTASKLAVSQSEALAIASHVVDSGHTRTSSLDPESWRVAVSCHAMTLPAAKTACGGVPSTCGTASRTNVVTGCQRLPDTLLR